MTPDPADLIACPSCDALYRADVPALGQRAVCSRCHAVLIRPRRGAGAIIIALSTASAILAFAALWLPFIHIRALGIDSGTTILEAALSFGGGPMALLSLAVLAMIVFLPLARLLLTLYVLVPIVAGRAPNPQAKAAFRLSEAIRPWSMAEIFLIGCAVALVKIADLARVDIGPAFWLFALLVVLVTIQDTFMCRWSVWSALED